LFLCFWNTKKFWRFLVDALIGFYTTQNRLKMKKIMGFEIKEDLEVFHQKMKE
jgi:hypothetical protein